MCSNDSRTRAGTGEGSFLFHFGLTVIICKKKKKKIGKFCWKWSEMVLRFPLLYTNIDCVKLPWPLCSSSKEPFKLLSTCNSYWLSFLWHQSCFRAHHCADISAQVSAPEFFFFSPPAVHTQRLHPTQISGANEQMQRELTEAVIYTLRYWYLDKFHI